MKMTLRELKRTIRLAVKEARDYPDIDASYRHDDDWVRDYPEDEGHGAPDIELIGLDDLTPDQRERLIEDEGIQPTECSFEYVDADLVATHDASGRSWFWEDDIGAWTNIDSPGSSIDVGRERWGSE
jgi:hypothetical protein